MRTNSVSITWGKARSKTIMQTLEICAGAGGQALGLEQAGFKHVAVIEIDEHCCASLRANRPAWNVFGGGGAGDITQFDGRPYRGQIDLLAGGIPCPPFSIAGKQLGEQDERNLFPDALRLVEEVQPRAVMIENVPGLLAASFDGYRARIVNRLAELGFKSRWEKLNASDFGVPQFRPRAVLVAIEPDCFDRFYWPSSCVTPALTVGETIGDLMAERGWERTREWTTRANKIAPTIVGGSKKHGGPDLGPTRAKQAWDALGVNGHLIADAAPAQGFIGSPMLTVRMVARLQGFPDEWQFAGRKTNAYRQVGNAFPPPVARAVGLQILHCLAVDRLRAAG